MSKPHVSDGIYAANVLLAEQAKGTRLALTSSSAAIDADDITSGGVYKVGLDPSSSGVGWFQWAASASLPADKATETAGFWLMPGETEIVEAQANRIAGILTAGTGTLYLTRLG
jgi:hypothetical protein